MLVDAHDQLLRRDEELRSALTVLREVEETRKEIEALRRSVIEQLEISTIPPDLQRLRGYHLESPRPGAQTDLFEIRVEGWVLGRSSAAIAVELASDGAILHRAPIVIPRPDIVAAFEVGPGLDRSGFFTTLRVLEMAAASEVVIQIVLQDGNHVPIASMRMRQGSRRAESIQKAAKLEVEAAQREAAELRETARQAKVREEELRRMLLDAHDQLLRRDEEIQSAVAQSVRRSASSGTGDQLAANGCIAGGQTSELSATDPRDPRGGSEHSAA